MRWSRRAPSVRPCRRGARLSATLGATKSMPDSPPTSMFCTRARAVIQIHSGNTAGEIMIAGRRGDKIAAWMILPGDVGTLACPLNYFQERASLRGGWITSDDGQRIVLQRAAGLDSVTVTILENGRESECGLPDQQERALLNYFMMDIAHNEAGYAGFDCYAFVSFLTNSAFRPESPPFEYVERHARAGEIIAVTNGPNLPESIKHWALCVGQDLFISKFGNTGDGAQALVETTGKQAMLSLYSCDRALVAKKKVDAPPWDCERWPRR